MGQFARDGVALSSYVLFFIQRKGNHSQNRVYSPSTLRSLHLINAVEHLARSVNDMNQQTDLLILDFSKAFDKVAHKRLLLKLEYYGIRGWNIMVVLYGIRTEHITSWLEQVQHKAAGFVTRTDAEKEGCVTKAL